MMYWRPKELYSMHTDWQLGRKAPKKNELALWQKTPKKNKSADASAMQTKTLQHEVCLYRLHVCCAYYLHVCVVELVCGVRRQPV